MKYFQSKQNSKYRFTKRFKIGLIIAAYVLVVLFIILSVLNSSINQSSRKSVQSVNSKVNSSTYTYRVKRGILTQAITGVGVIVPAKAHDIGFGEFSGPFYKLFVTNGANVKAGDMVAEVKSDNIEYLIHQQELEIDRARVRISQFRDRVMDIQKSMEAEMIDYNSIIQSNKALAKRNTEDLKKSKLLLEQLQYQLAAAQKAKNIEEFSVNNLEQFDKDYEKEIARIKLEQSMDNINSISTAQEVTRIEASQSAQNGVAQYSKGLDDIKRINIRLEQLKINLRILEKERLMANIDLRGLLLALKDMKTRLNNCKLVSPVTGIVSHLDKVAENDFITNGEIIAKIVDKNDVVMKVNSGNLTALSYGMTCTVMVGDHAYEAKVYKPQPGELLDFMIDNIDPKTQRFLKIKNILSSFKMNDQVDVKIKIKKKENALIIPKASVKSEGVTNWVEVLEHGKVNKRIIKIGQETLNNVEVLQGLKEGENILREY